MADQTPSLLQDPFIDYPNLYSDLPFADYITQSRQIIETTRLDLNENATTIIEANSPFESLSRLQSRYGALLIHGLLDSPFLMKDIAYSLQAANIAVKAVLLPGHGTRPGSLLNTDYHDWLATVRYGINALAKEVENIVLVGFSTGATLALMEAFNEPLGIKKLILLSPALKINSRFDFISSWYRLFSWRWERAKWFFIAKEIDYAKYQSIPFNAIYQVYRLTLALRKITTQKNLPCPFLMVASENDSTVSPRATLNYFKHQPNPQNKMLFYSENSTSSDPRILSRPAIYPKMGIKSFSHIAIPIAPTNPHYGMEGDFIYASHIKSHQAIEYGEMQNADIVKYIRDSSKTLHKRQRLSFNPDFEFMMQFILDFIHCSKEDCS